MCRRDQVWAVAVLGFGVGMLLAVCFESGFLCGCIGVLAMIVSGVILQKK